MGYFIPPIPLFDPENHVIYSQDNEVPNQVIQDDGDMDDINWLVLVICFIIYILSLIIHYNLDFHCYNLL